MTNWVTTTRRKPIRKLTGLCVTLLGGEEGIEGPHASVTYFIAKINSSLESKCISLIAFQK